jgi:hypothetical protein
VGDRVLVHLVLLQVAVNSTSARRPSAYAFCSISERRTSGWWMMLTRGADLSVIWVRSAPWTRSLAYSRAFRYAVDSVAIALVPTIIRAYSMTRNICAVPSCTSPTRVPTAGSFSPKRSSQVVETFRPILCSTLVT